ncbi:MAG: hypothetical protein CMD25_00905 [Flavobacteriales bacterium]|nr:hypothetical protein [Flavobacteriales bacterium]
MSKNVNLKRTVFDKAKFNETVDTNFTQLQSELDPQFFDLSLATIEDFWSLYEKFFYEIPKEGDINSHEYLVKTSGEYIDYQPQREEIEALLEEIAELREENLEVRQEIADVVANFNENNNNNNTSEARSGVFNDKRRRRRRNRRS